MIDAFRTCSKGGCVVRPRRNSFRAARAPLRIQSGISNKHRTSKAYLRKFEISKAYVRDFGISKAYLRNIGISKEYLRIFLIFLKHT